MAMTQPSIRSTARIVEAGTDTGMIALFDPAALPPEYDSLADKQIDVLRELDEQGRLFHFETGSDGAFLLHAYVEEPSSSYIQPYLREPIERNSFDASSGRAYFAGAEYVFRDDDQRLRKNPGMGDHLEVPPGCYHVTIYHTEYPEDLMENELRHQISDNAFKLHSNFGCLVGLAILGIGGAAISYPLLPTSIWAVTAVPVALVLLAVPIAVSRTRVYRETARKWDIIQRRYPSLVVEFRHTSPGETAERLP